MREGIIEAWVPEMAGRDGMQRKSFSGRKSHNREEGMYGCGE